MKFVSCLVGGVCYAGVELYMVVLLLVLSRFYCLGGGVECVLGHSPYEFGMVTPSERFPDGMLSGGVVSTGIIPGVFVLLMCWCVRGSKRICIGSVGVDNVWVVCVGADGT